MLIIEGLSKTYGDRRGVEAVSFSLTPGEIVGFIGPNGAGKTTTLRMIAGTLEPDAGKVSVMGFDMWTQRQSAQALMGYLSEHAPLYDDMTPRSYIGFLLAARGFSRKETEAALPLALSRTEIEPAADERIRHLSKGYRQRVALAGVLAHDPPVLILDEPTDGLDPLQKRATRALIQSLSPGRIILISTHALDEISAFCTRVITILDGHICGDESPQALSARTPSGRLEDGFFALADSRASLAAPATKANKP
jgi:ABC-2 type transport system ATP-binding protein